MTPMALGRYRARQAGSPTDLAAVQALRARAFARPGGRDDDSHDACCAHVLVETHDAGTPVACFRMADLGPADLVHSYAARFYDLCGLGAHGGPMLEIGRFCLAPEWRDPDILRLAWAALATRVDDRGARLLFGCASFPGADPARHAAALAHLGARHLGPSGLRPARRAAETVALDSCSTSDAKDGLRTMPPLLRTYLGLGGWVGDHAVIDRDMDTLHVFTAVEVARIPEARARSLRRVAALAASA